MSSAAISRYFWNQLTRWALPCVLLFWVTGQSRAQMTGSVNPKVQYRAFLDQYCTTCHNEQTKTAGLLLDKADLSRLSDQADLWEKVIRRLRVGSMPPQGMPRPDRDKSDQFASWIEGTIDRAALAAPKVGRYLIHRLNRAEYGNSIRDLLA